MDLHEKQEHQKLFWLDVFLQTTFLLVHRIPTTTSLSPWNAWENIYPSDVNWTIAFILNRAGSSVEEACSKWQFPIFSLSVFFPIPPKMPILHRDLLVGGLWRPVIINIIIVILYHRVVIVRLHKHTTQLISTTLTCSSTSLRSHTHLPHRHSHASSSSPSPVTLFFRGPVCIFSTPLSLLSRHWPSWLTLRRHAQVSYISWPSSFHFSLSIW